MRTARLVMSETSSVPVVFAVILSFAVLAGHLALAGPSAEDIIYQTNELKIYRATSRDGAPVVVLTNLDEEGNRFSPAADSEGTRPPRLTSGRAEPGLAGPAPEAGDRPSGTPAPSGSVRVVVNKDGDRTGGDDGGVEVTTDGPGGTTVIININPPPPPAREPEAARPDLLYPVMAFGGLAGGYRYPEHLYFLGYGLDTSSPSWFGGLGLNAGNRFGLKQGSPCNRGFDCMFGPKEAHP